MRQTEQMPSLQPSAMGLPHSLQRVLVRDADRAEGGELAGFSPSSPPLEQVATQTPHSLHFHGVMTARVWPSGRSSNLMAPARHAFSHRPQAKHFSVKLGRW